MSMHFFQRDRGDGCQPAAAPKSAGEDALSPEERAWLANWIVDEVHDLEHAPLDRPLPRVTHG